MNFMFLVTIPRVILMAASIGHYWCVRHYWSRDLDQHLVQLFCLFVFRAFSPFTVAQFLCVLHFGKNSFAMKIAERPLPTFTLKQFYEEKVGSEFSDTADPTQLTRRDLVAQVQIIGLASKT